MAERDKGEAALYVADEEALQSAEAYRRRKKTSVLAIVFTDIADSTSTRERLGEEEYESLREDFEERFQSIVCEADAGVVVKGTGDGALAVFAEPSTAVERCVAVQRNLRGHQFRLRIGIDLGQVALKSSFGIVGDVFGRHVNRAARIEALAHPGHVLTSFPVYDCAVGWLREGDISWISHGSHALKGFADEVWVHEAFDPRIGSPQAPLTPPQPEIKFSDSVIPRFARTGFALMVGERSLPPSWVSPLGQQLADPVRVEVGPSPSSGDPIKQLNSQIRVLAVLLHRTSTPRILWVDDHPKNNTRVADLLESAGIAVDLARTTSKALKMLGSKNYLMAITDMGRDNNPTAGLDFIRKVAEEKVPVPLILFASQGAIAQYGEQAKELGCALATAGFVTLLHGIKEVLRMWDARLS